MKRNFGKAPGFGEAGLTEFPRSASSPDHKQNSWMAKPREKNSSTFFPFVFSYGDYPALRLESACDVTRRIKDPLGRSLYPAGVLWIPIPCTVLVCGYSIQWIVQHFFLKKTDWPCTGVLSTKTIDIVWIKSLLQIYQNFKKKKKKKTSIKINIWHLGCSWFLLLPHSRLSLIFPDRIATQSWQPRIWGGKSYEDHYIWPL